MHGICFVLIISELVLINLATQPMNFSGKSYYFKTNANNEFTVYNRIHFLNHNISDLDVNPHPPQNVKILRSNKNVLPNGQPHKNVLPKKHFLDEEWNYEHKPLNKSDLPVFIKKFYEQRIREPNKTDTLRIFFNSNRNSSSSKIIKFNLPKLTEEEKFVDADMYFYWPLENSSSLFKTSVVLKLYQYEKPVTNELNESHLEENPDLHKLFNVIYISKAQNGWQTFKIKKPIDNWSNGEENYGLLLTISTYDENKLISVFNDTNQSIFRTFAVLTIKKNDTQPSFPYNQTTLDHLQHTTLCSKRPWHVDWQQLHWNNLILYPENGTMLYQCAGKCHISDQDHHINHVRMREFTNGFHVREKVCCVPTEYYSLPIMFQNTDGGVVMKNYDKMVVKGCGCR
ncbi:bone morphogenetic protein 2-like [Anthonomus grandis grandis]|uniref:bone morphogenetic protein 2-like n=1 Tax=Anthonomus grandis grandis TaxID=2921223 RepID=UPI002165866B|nr:bone morphogenetic protein 2-like [Anthonomus grandis grandis]